jgi:hypothetical protein
MRPQQEFKPYYLVQAYSKRLRKQQTQFMSTEHGKNHELRSLIEAKRRSVEYAASLNEITSMGASDWTPIVRFVSEDGKFIVE